MLALFSAPSSFFTISQAAADDAGAETQRTVKFNGDTLDGLAINTNQFGRIFEDRNGGKFTLEKFNGDTLTGFNGDTLSFNGDTLEKFNGDTLSFNGDTLEKFNGDTLRFNGLISFNGDTLSFNGDSMSFNGDTLERFNADDLMKDFKDFNGDLVKFNGDTLAKFNGDLLFNDGPRAFNGDTLAFNGDLHEWKGKGPPPPAGRVHGRHRPVGRGRARGVKRRERAAVHNGHGSRVCMHITYRSERTVSTGPAPPGTPRCGSCSPACRAPSPRARTSRRNSCRRRRSCTGDGSRGA